VTILREEFFRGERIFEQIEAAIVFFSVWPRSQRGGN